MKATTTSASKNGKSVGVSVASGGDYFEGDENNFKE